MADRLERVNQSLTQENSRLKTQFQSQEDDRNFLIQQLVAVKKDNEKIRMEYNAADAECKRLIDQRAYLAKVGGSSAPGFPPANNTNAKGGAVDSKAKADSEERYREVNVRLRRLLAEERKALAVTRNNYAAELRSRTEMELLLRQCVEEVRKEIAKK